MKINLILLLLLIPCEYFSQADTNKVDFHGYLRDTIYCVRHGNYHPEGWSKSLALKTGYMYSSHHSTEIGIEWLRLVGPFCDQQGTMGLTIGSDFLFDKRIIYGPKVSAEAHWMFFGTRLNLTYYTQDFNLGSFKIRPEIGLTLLGYVNVFYGYTFNATNPDYYNQKHSISIFGNLPVLKFHGRRRVKSNVDN